MAVLYRHIRLDSNQPFYIGIGKTEKRAYSKRNRNKHWHGVVNKHGYKVHIMLDDLTWEEACEKEREFIQLYGRKDLDKGSLINLTDGGDGVVNLKHSEEAKEKMRKPKSKEHIANLSAAQTGKKHSAERIANNSAAQKGKPKPKIAAALRGKPKSAEARAKMSAAKTGKKLTEEHKANMRKAAKLRWESKAGLQKRAEMSELLTNYHKLINN